MAETGWQEAELEAVRELTPDIREMWLRPVRAERFQPGAHLAVVPPCLDGPRAARVRHYSLVGEADGMRYRIAVRRDRLGRGGSAAMHAMEVGATLAVSAPVHGLRLNLAAPFHLLVAGGIGVTPLLGMAELLARRGRGFGVLYVGRAPAVMAYHDRIREICGDAARFQYTAGGGRPDFYSVFEEIPAASEVMLCGPEGMAAAARAAWARAGRNAARLREENFGAAIRPGDAPFEVEIPSLGRVASVAAGQTMLEALEAAGIAVLSNCRRGECGLCVLSVLEGSGAILHRDRFLDPAEQAAGTRICACVSRAEGRVRVAVARR